LADGLRHHRRFRAAALLLENVEWLIKLWIPLANLFAKDANLCVLAAQAEDRGSGDVGMVNVAGDQSAEIVGIFPRAAAAAFVQQEANAVNVREKAVALRRN
jgi:hypothetical protein